MVKISGHFQCRLAGDRFFTFVGFADLWSFMTSKLCLPLLALFVVLFIASTVSAQIPRVFTVDSTADSVDAAAGDGRCADSSGRCTLRAAVGEANAGPTPDVIIFGLPAPSTITLTIGEIVMTSPMEVIGPGARRLVVTKTNLFSPFRVFRIAQGNGLRRISIRGMTISQGNDVGGAICIEAANTVVVSDVTLTSNRGTLGAAIYNEGTLTLSRSFIGGNGVETAANHGGGLYNAAAGTASVYNTTFSGNFAGDGGAIYNAGDLRLVNDTIAGNRATAASSILANGVTPVKVMNTIIGRDSSNGANAIAGVFTSGGNNIVTDARDSEGFVNGINNDRVSDNNVIDPMLGAVADNGGQTDSMLPLSGSPAVDGGNSCVFDAACGAPFDTVRIQRDQRFLSRRAGATVDIGAAERLAAPFNFPSLGRPIRALNRFGGARVVLTNTVTNAKVIRPLLPTGNTSLPLSATDVEVAEIIGKRAGQYSFTIFDPDAVVIFIINGKAEVRPPEDVVRR